MNPHNSIKRRSLVHTKLLQSDQRPNNDSDGTVTVYASQCSFIQIMLLQLGKRMEHGRGRRCAGGFAWSTAGI
ncbi:hypothetical protein [Thermincola ferriacetica]